MTDKPSITATLPTDGAELRISCMHGKPFPEIVFNHVVGLGRIDTKHRFDDGPIVLRDSPLSSSGAAVWPWFMEPADYQRIVKSHRLRVQLFPLASPAIMLDFDLTGAREALSQIACSK